uniref:Uncharacterized protein n=1 Tax=Hydrogenobacter sp. TaxID=2152829 RepID=A0A7C2V667_9AQUI
MKELVHNEHVFVAKAKKEELHTVLRRLYENGTVFIYREDESLLLMIPSKEIVEVELDSRRVWSGILICGDVFRLVILKDTCPCVILADTLSQVAEALLYM